MLCPHVFAPLDANEKAVTRDARRFGPSLASLASNPSSLYASPEEYARLYGNAGPPKEPPRRR